MAKAFYLFVALLTLTGRVLVYAVGPTTTPPPQPAAEHSLFSWDYGEVLGEESGWWSQWYPACDEPYQSPIDISSASAVNSSVSLVMATVTGKPIEFLTCVMAFNDTFNYLRADARVERMEIYFYWDNASSNEKTSYVFDYIRVVHPSEHRIDGVQYDVEVSYFFRSTEEHSREVSRDPTDLLDADHSVSLTFLFTKVADGMGDPYMEGLFDQLDAGSVFGITSIQAVVPEIDALYHYTGSRSAPPCNGGVQHFIKATPLPIQTSTLARLRTNQPHWKQYRGLQDLESRPVKVVKFIAKDVMPVFSTKPLKSVYTLADDPPEYANTAQKYFMIMAGVMTGLMLLAVIWLLFERWTYQVPYNLTWRDPHTGREVFGASLRYGYSTGLPKPKGDDDKIVTMATASAFSESSDEVEEGEGPVEADEDGTGPIHPNPLLPPISPQTRPDAT